MCAWASARFPPGDASHGHDGAAWTGGLTAPAGAVLLIDESSRSARCREVVCTATGACLREPAPERTVPDAVTAPVARVGRLGSARPNGALSSRSSRATE